MADGANNAIIIAIIITYHHHHIPPEPQFLPYDGAAWRDVRQHRALHAMRRICESYSRTDSRVSHSAHLSSARATEMTLVVTAHSAGIMTLSPRVH
jgi:hypothetical protein